MSSPAAVTPFVVSVILLSVKVAERATSVFPQGHEKPVGDTEPVSRTTLPLIRPFLSEATSTDTGTVTMILHEAVGRLPSPFAQPNVAVTTVLMRYTTSGFPRPISDQVYSRLGSTAETLPLDVALRAVADELPAKLTDAVLKCGKFAYAGDATPTTTATAATMTRPRCATLRVSRFGFCSVMSAPSETPLLSNATSPLSLLARDSVRTNLARHALCPSCAQASTSSPPSLRDDVATTDAEPRRAAVRAGWPKDHPP